MGNTLTNLNSYIELLRHLGAKKIKVRENNNWIMCCCPFAKWRHTDGQDREPSFGINLSNGVFHCFGCGIKGHVSRIYQIWKKVTGISDEYLKKYSSSEVFIPKLFRNVSPRKPKYVRIIPFPPYSGDMFTKKTVKTFSLRYDPKERRVIIPIRYYNNRVVALKGRYLGLDSEVPRYRFYKEYGGTMPHSLGIWFGYHLPIEADKPLILVEGERNLLKLWDAGIYNVWASGGAEISNAQLQTLRLCEAKKIILFMDNDKGGERASERIYEKLKDYMVFYKVEDYKGCNDPAEIVEKGLLREVLKSIRRVK